MKIPSQRAGLIVALIVVSSGMPFFLVQQQSCEVDDEIMAKQVGVAVSGIARMMACLNSMLILLRASKFHVLKTVLATQRGSRSC